MKVTNIFGTTMNYLYDSLDTLKQVRKPTGKEIVEMTIAIIVIAILAGIYFAVADGIFVTLYQEFYNLMR